MGRPCGVYVAHHRQNKCQRMEDIARLFGEGKVVVKAASAVTSAVQSQPKIMKSILAFRLVRSRPAAFISRGGI